MVLFKLYGLLLVVDASRKVLLVRTDGKTLWQLPQCELHSGELLPNQLVRAAHEQLMLTVPVAELETGPTVFQKAGSEGICLLTGVYRLHQSGLQLESTGLYGEYGLFNRLPKTILPAHEAVIMGWRGGIQHIALE